jgi:hypothetical protein
MAAAIGPSGVLRIREISRRARGSAGIPYSGLRRNPGLAAEEQKHPGYQRPTHHQIITT